MADYAWYQRDLEGNCNERTTTDPYAFTSEKVPHIGEKAQVHAVQSDSDGRTETETARDRSPNDLQEDGMPITRGRDAEKRVGMARGEGGLSPARSVGVERVESGRGHSRIRGAEFKAMEGHGRGEGGVPDRDGAL